LSAEARVVRSCSRKPQVAGRQVTCCANQARDSHVCSRIQCDGCCALVLQWLQATDSDIVQREGAAVPAGTGGQPSPAAWL
jgi:hypothetical protein